MKDSDWSGIKLLWHGADAFLNEVFKMPHSIASGPLDD